MFPIAVLVLGVSIPQSALLQQKQTGDQIAVAMTSRTLPTVQRVVRVASQETRELGKAAYDFAFA